MTTPAAWDRPRTAIVTGAGSGIGLAIAQRLVQEGASVALFDRNLESVEAAAAELTPAPHAGVRAYAVDVARPDQVRAAVERTATDLGAATILVNNAGISPFKRFVDITTEDFQQVLDVNLLGTFHCCQAVVAGMFEQHWGRIVNISSSSAQVGNAWQVHYSASKAAVIGLTRSLAKELGPKGITVNTIPPGFVDTPSLRSVEQAGFLGSGVEEHERTTPVRRVGHPQDLAAAVAFLVRDDAGYITGQVLGVNGGRTIV